MLPHELSGARELHTHGFAQFARGGEIALARRGLSPRAMRVIAIGRVRGSRLRRTVTRHDAAIWPAVGNRTSPSY